MSCSNCFNGCTDIISDKCVKYTGTDVPLLGIKNGDSLSYVEQTLIGFLTPVLDGTGIIPNIPDIVCLLISQGLPDCGNITIVDYINALINAVCNLQEQIDTVNITLGDLNADYTIPDCLTIGPDAGTHDVLQDVINTLCALNTALNALAIQISTEYVAITDLDTLIQAYLNSIAVTNLMCNKMIPYSILPFYGTLAGKFDGTGAGIVGSVWEHIFLCNGSNTTPDLRGRAPIGVTNMFGTIAVDADRAAFPYTLGVPIAAGTNTVALSLAQLASHTHAASIPIVTNPPHYHFEFTSTSGTNQIPLSTNFASVEHVWGTGDQNYQIEGNSTAPTLARTSSESANVSVAASSISAVGLNAAHNNIQPGIGLYYIIYIP